MITDKLSKNNRGEKIAVAILVLHLILWIVFYPITFRYGFLLAPLPAIALVYIAYKKKVLLNLFLLSIFGAITLGTGGIMAFIGPFFEGGSFPGYGMSITELLASFLFSFLGWIFIATAYIMLIISIIQILGRLRQVPPEKSPASENTTKEMADAKRTFWKRALLAVAATHIAMVFIPSIFRKHPWFHAFYDLEAAWGGISILHQFLPPFVYYRFVFVLPAAIYIPNQTNLAISTNKLFTINIITYIVSLNLGKLMFLFLPIDFYFSSGFYLLGNLIYTLQYLCLTMMLVLIISGGIRMVTSWKNEAE